MLGCVPPNGDSGSRANMMENPGLRGRADEGCTLVNIAREPSREIRRLALRIEQGLGYYLRVRSHTALSTQWEAPRHGWALSNLALRHAEAVTLLARTDLVLHAPAWLASRAALEAAARTHWLMAPTDDWVRECRWLALLHEGARFGQRAVFSDAKPFSVRANDLEEFAHAVHERIPTGYDIPGIPSVSSLVAELGDSMAGYYILASQFTHSSELATGQFRNGLGDIAIYGEHVSASDWVPPLVLSWNAVRMSCSELMATVTSHDADLLSRIDDQVEEAAAAAAGTT